METPVFSLVPLASLHSVLLMSERTMTSVKSVPSMMVLELKRAEDMMEPATLAWERGRGE